MTFIAFAGIAKAGEYVVYQPEAPEAVYFTSESDNNQPTIKFPFVKSGDIIKIYYTNVTSECAIIWRGKTSGDWKWETITTGSNGELSYSVPTSNQTYASEDCTSDEIVASLKERGLTLTGTFKILSISVTDNNSQVSSTSQTLFTSQNYNLGNWAWDSRITLPIQTYNFAQVKVGDIMRIAYTSDATITEDVAAINLKESQNESHTVLASVDNIAQNTSGNFDIEITQDILDYLKGGYGYLTGKYISITALNIISSHEALTETISNTSLHFGNWTSNYEPTADNCANTNEGDVLNISYTVPNEKTDGCIFLRNKSNGWAQISEYVVSNLSGTGTVHFPINATILSLLKAGNIAISGSGAEGTDNTNGVEGTGVTISHFTTSAGYRPVYIPASGYATFYGASTLALPDGLEAYYVSETSSTAATLSSLTNIPASQGVILKGTTGIYQLYTTTDDAASVSGNKLVGAVTRTQITDATNKYVLYNNSVTPEFRTITADTYLDAYKCYLNTTTNAPRLSIVFDNETTGISAVGQETAGDQRIYNMNGQVVTSAKRGLYIKNGKKYIVK